MLLSQIRGYLLHRRQAYWLSRARSLERTARTSIAHAVANCLEGEFSREDLLRLKVMAERSMTLTPRDTGDPDWLRAAIIATWATARLAAEEHRVAKATIVRLTSLMAASARASTVQPRAASEMVGRDDWPAQVMSDAA